MTDNEIYCSLCFDKAASHQEQDIFLCDDCWGMFDNDQQQNSSQSHNPIPNCANHLAQNLTGDPPNHYSRMNISFK